MYHLSVSRYAKAFAMLYKAGVPITEIVRAGHPGHGQSWSWRASSPGPGDSVRQGAWLGKASPSGCPPSIGISGRSGRKPASWTRSPPKSAEISADRADLFFTSLRSWFPKVVYFAIMIFMAIMVLQDWRARVYGYSGRLLRPRGGKPRHRSGTFQSSSRLPSIRPTMLTAEAARISSPSEAGVAPEEDAEGAARRPEADLAGLDHLAGAGLDPRLDGDGEVDLPAPAARPGLDGQSLHDRQGRRRIVQNSLEPGLPAVIVIRRSIKPVGRMKCQAGGIE